MSKVGSNGVNIIMAMPCNDFRRKCVRGICSTRSFGALASFFAKEITPEEKLEVRRNLAKIGIPFDITERDDDLDAIAAAISARAVSHY